MLKIQLNDFVLPNYGKTKRTPQTYKTVANYCSTNLIRLIKDYKEANRDAQLLREMRNDIDNYLRRYHEYCIKQREGIGAHYIEQDLEEEHDFEHLIPASRIRDLLLENKISVTQALNAPTVLLSRSKHKLLREAGLASRTPDMWLPFLRYKSVFDCNFITYDGYKIDPENWTLENHFNYFCNLII